MRLPPEAGRAASRAFPGHRITACEPAAGGVLNDVYRLSVDGFDDRFALRIHTRDASAWDKELALQRLVASRVPVPEVLGAEGAAESRRPWILMRWVEGETFRQIKSRDDAAEIAQCGRAMGEVLARIGEFEFPAGGMIGPGLEIAPGPLEGPDPAPRMIEMFLASPAAAARLSPAKIARICDFAWSRAAGLAAIEGERSLVHSDFGAPNLVMRAAKGQWEIAAVLDWEFAFSGSPLHDVGHVLRCRRDGLEPAFPDAYRAAGGRLPENWRSLARTLDLTDLTEMLSRPSLPDAAAVEISGMIDEILRTC